MKPGTPCSAMVGISGSSVERCAVLMPSARSRPDLICVIVLPVENIDPRYFEHFGAPEERESRVAVTKSAVKKPAAN